MDKDGKLAPDIHSQTKQVMENIKVCLEAAGSSFSKILKTKVFLTDFALYSAINGVYGDYFSSQTAVVRSSIKAEAMAGRELVTIEAIATLGEKQIIDPPGVKQRRPGVATCIRAGDLIFASGCVGNYDWETPNWKYGPDTPSQSKQMMENMKHWLKACGSSMDQLVRVLLLINDRVDFEVMDEVYRSYFSPDMLPTRMTFEHPSSGPIFNELVEIYAVATVGKKEAIYPPGMKPTGAWSPVVRAGDFVFVSGLTGRGKDGRLAPDIRSQTKQTLDNIKVCLEAAGSSLDKVVRVLVFLTDIRNLKTMDEVYSGHFAKAGLPTRTAVQMNRPTDPELITMEVIATL
jgi:2-iminobutanoate/2-iminopropanoate deaminase